MIRKIDHLKMGKSDLGWLKSVFHFSFANYYNPNNMSFGVLRVINDDLVAPKTGFDTHPHKDMEIISYVVDGHLTHGDSMGHKNTITRGQVQYMSAGSGVYHNEHNLGDTMARFLQIWILPRRKNLEPTYGDFGFEWEARHNQWLHIVSDKNGNAPIQINQDVSMYVAELDAGGILTFEVKEGRQAYLLQIEGSSRVADVLLDARDAMETTEQLNIQALTLSHMMIIEMAR